MKDEVYDGEIGMAIVLCIVYNVFIFFPNQLNRIFVLSFDKFKTRIYVMYTHGTYNMYLILYIRLRYQVHALTAFRIVLEEGESDIKYTIYSIRNCNSFHPMILIFS